MILLAWLGCASLLEDDTPLVEAARVLAVALSPAEVEPGQEVLLEALYADAGGALDQGNLFWAACTRRKALAESGPVSDDCLDPSSPHLAPLGEGLAVTVTIDPDACSLFGPNPPPPEPGQPSGRPVDPDVTGGFYAPILVFDDDVPTLVSVRLRCGLANVDQETFITWNQGYASNVAPTPTLITPPSVSPGEVVTVSVGWDGGAEEYLVYDPVTAAFANRREAVSATWFTTGGGFAAARNGRAGDEPEEGVDNRWTAPDAPGEVWLAVVVRDERGGVAFASATIEVR